MNFIEIIQTKSTNTQKEKGKSQQGDVEKKLCTPCKLVCISVRLLTPATSFRIDHYHVPSADES